MYDRSGTGRRAAQAPGRCFVYTHQVAALHCMKRRHGHHLVSVNEIENSKNNPAKFHLDAI